MSSWFRSYGFADVHDGLIIGAYPLDGDDVDTLARMGVREVLNLVEDQEYPPGQRQQVAEALERAGITETRLQLTDFGRLPADQLEPAVRQVVDWMQDGRLAYVHCRAGWQRSAAVAMGAVAISDGVPLEDAIAQVQRRKPSADPLPHQREDLRTWWTQRSHLHRRD